MTDQTDPQQVVRDSLGRVLCCHGRPIECVECGEEYAAELVPPAPAPAQQVSPNDAAVLRAAIRSLDCGVHHCRYCEAKSPAWEHVQGCAYVESQRHYREAYDIIQRLEAHPAAPAPPRHERQEHAHDFHEFMVCRVCGLTEAAALNECHHCGDDTSVKNNRCWWCLRPLAAASPSAPQEVHHGEVNEAPASQDRDPSTGPAAEVDHNHHPSGVTPTHQVIQVPDVEHPTAILCYQQSPGMVRCDRAQGHTGRHSWAIA